MEGMSDRIISMLDEIERRVENLRETGIMMEQEKETLMEMLQTVQMNKDMLKISQSEKADIDATTNRLLSRTRTVEINVSTPRNHDQERSLRAAHAQIEELLVKLQEDIGNAQQNCRQYLNACSPTTPDGPIDQRFQSVIIGCTVDDQKKIRHRLDHISQLIERVDRTIAQAFQ